jgi:hypothetical protein
MRTKIYLESESQTPTTLLQSSFKKLSTKSEQLPRNNFDQEKKRNKYDIDSVFPPNSYNLVSKTENWKGFEARLADRYSSQEFIAFFKEDLNENMYMNKALSALFKKEKIINGLFLCFLILFLGLPCLFLKSRYLGLLSFLALLFLRLYSIESKE